MMRTVRTLLRNTDGAVAPTIALSLVGLIAAGGIAFDYARLAALDTELQNAADQAALAAVTQLDGQANATTRAIAAARALVVNHTRLANDGSGVVVQTGQDVTDANGNVTGVRVLFYATKADAEADINGFVSTSANADATAKFVKVAVTERRVNYALTPIAAAFSSPNIAAEATAGLGTAICKVPPVMICNPDEPSGNGNVNYDFNANGLRGYGLKLVSVGNGPSAWAPGNFGYLDTGSSTSNPNVELRQALGWSTAPGDCSALDGVETRTGAGTTVTAALNTRFDIYERPAIKNNNNASCPVGASCPPSINTVKDVYQRGSPNAANKCDVANNEWEQAAEAEAYRPTNTTDLTQAEADLIKIMGHPRDKCHAISINGSCTYNSVTPSKIGDGQWDRNAYFRVNYGWTSTEWPTNVALGAASARITTFSSTRPTRYEVYLWEIANRGAVIGGRTILAARAYGTGGNPETDFDQPVCSALQTPSTSGVVPGVANVDRRRISAAVLNCNARNVHGGGPTVYPVLKWIELFLVEPSINRGSGGGQRTDPNDVYVEIIGETTSSGANSTAGQVVRRDVPYLVR